MPRWPRPQNLTRLFVGQHIINGVSVGLGVVAVALVASEMFGFVARALDYSGQVFEDDKPDTLAEAMATLEKGLSEYFEREGIEFG